MRVSSAALTMVGLLLAPCTGFAAVHPHHHTSTQAMVRHSTLSRSHHAEHATNEHFVGSSMSSDRATEIQSALIRTGYLSGTPSGTWDSSSIAAMQKLQSDNGWQTKLIPDSRALIKLGLGPGTTPAPATTPGALATVEPPPAY